MKDRKTEKIFDIQGLRYSEYDESLRIDAVSKDSLKIRNAIEETGNCSPRDMNSIVQLAGIQIAEVPTKQIISADTQLILSAIMALNRRVQDVEEAFDSGNTYFVINDRGAMFDDAHIYKIGTELYRNMRCLGKYCCP